MENKIKSLIDAIKTSGEDMETRREDLDFIVERIQHLADYVNAVVMMSVQVQVLYAKGLDQQDLVDKIQSIDTKRRMMHDVAIDSCVQLDRLCVVYECEPFCGLTIEHTIDGKVTGECRHQFAAFIGRTINQIFKDEIYVDRTDEFVKNITKEQMKVVEAEIEKEEE